jgi:hypothetical protein
MDYVVSYIYEKEEREARRDELQHLTLRLMSRQEAEHIVREAGRRAGVTIRPLVFYDRSVFTGRHMDTGDYNPHAQPMRAAVNSLHEVNQRTDLNELMIDYAPREGFDPLNRHFAELQRHWNFVVQYVARLLELFDEELRVFCGDLPEIPPDCPLPVKAMTDRMRQVVEGTGWFGMGLPRENIIEPQLGYALRTVVSGLQQGQGCGHGLVGILEICR